MAVEVALGRPSGVHREDDVRGAPEEASLVFPPLRPYDLAQKQGDPWEPHTCLSLA